MGPARGTGRGGEAGDGGELCVGSRCVGDGDAGCRILDGGGIGVMVEERTIYSCCASL